MIAQLWNKPATVERNNFKYKSLSSWSYNVAVGCQHSCKYCFVPNVSTIKLGPKLKPLGVEDPDMQWGEYVFVRPWDPNAFRASIRRAMAIHPADLNKDGNRAVMFCTTTDPYQTISIPGVEGRKLNDELRHSVRSALEIIRDESDLNVRILTRSPLAAHDFGLMKTLGNRLLFGMSLPTLNNAIARIYEPKAPAPSKRLETLERAKREGLNVYVAVAPTYPECDEEDLIKTFLALKWLQPVTIFHEPINIRAENVKRIKDEAEKLGVHVKTEVFDTPDTWARYAKDQLLLVRDIAEQLNLSSCLHLWPDANLPGKVKDPAFTELCKSYWNRVSEWPKA